MNNDIRNLTKWLNEDQEAPIDRQALARVLAMAEQPAQKRPQNCGTGYCSCIECVMEPAQQEPVAYMGTDSDGNPNKFRLNPFSGCVSLYEKPSPVQKPVAYMDICEKNQMSGLRYWSEPDNRHEVPLYTSPPAQRTWVGLTKSEITTSLPYSVTRDKGCFHAGALWAEAKLKEKNT